MSQRKEATGEEDREDEMQGWMREPSISNPTTSTHRLLLPSLREREKKKGKERERKKEMGI